MLPACYLAVVSLGEPVSFKVLLLLGVAIGAMQSGGQEEGSDLGDEATAINGDGEASEEEESEESDDELISDDRLDDHDAQVDELVKAVGGGAEGGYLICDTLW